jgi:polysaccharide biosynthesis transport protein
MREYVAPGSYPVPTAGGSQTTSSGSNFITHHDIIRFIKRYYVTISLTAFAGIVLALTYVLTSVPLYTARTQIIIDPSLPQALRDTGSSSIFSIDNAQVESQLEVLRSEKIAGAVIDKLDLENNPEFNVGSASLMSSLRGLFASEDGPVDPFIKRRATLYRLLAGLSVHRVGLSYAIDIQFRSRSPELSAQIANATAEAYVNEQIGARSQAARQGGVWLEQRIDQLRQQMNTAALEAKQFRARRDYRLAPSESDSNGDKGGRSSAADRRAAAVNRQNTLEELDATAQTYRRIYESYLTAYTEAVQKQSYPVTNARVITPATRPLSKSHPRSKLILAFGGLLGGLAGLAIAFFRHSIDRSVWGARQIREEIGVECLANIPLLVDHASTSLFSPATLSKAVARILRKADELADKAPRFLGPVARGVKSAASWAQGRQASGASSLSADAAPANGIAPLDVDTAALDAVVTMPFSSFSHGIKTLKSAISLAGRARQVRAIGVTSALPNEGKTTITANLATLFAMSGVRTLLVDGDLRNARLSHLLAPDAKKGLMDAVSGKAKVENCIVRAKESGLDLLPVADGLQAATYSDEIFGSKKMRDLIDRLQKSYDIIIFEMPPLTASLDGLTISSMLDSTVLVAEWGKTPMPILSEVVRLMRRARTEILGVALNKVDTSTMQYGDVVTNYSYASSSATTLTAMPTPARLSRRLTTASTNGQQEAS